MNNTKQRAFKKPLEDMLNKDGAWTERIEEGFIKGKIKDTRHLKDCRGVLPQSTVLQILTLLVSSAVEPLCSLYDLGDACRRNVFGHGRGGQIQDIISCASQVLEKGRDRHNCGAVAMQDVQSYHDSIMF